MRTAWLRNSAPVLLADPRRGEVVSQEAYRQGLDQNPANYVPLSPLTYLERAAYVYHLIWLELHRYNLKHGYRDWET